MVNKYPIVEAASRYTLVLGECGGDTRLVFPQKGGPPAWEAKQPLLVWSPANNHQQHGRRRQQAEGQRRRHAWCWSWWRWRWSQVAAAAAVVVVTKVWLTDCFWVSAKAGAQPLASSIVWPWQAGPRHWTAGLSYWWLRTLVVSSRGSLGGSGRHYWGWTAQQFDKVLCWINLWYWLVTGFLTGLRTWTVTRVRLRPLRTRQTSTGTLGTLRKTTWLLAESFSHKWNFLSDRTKQLANGSLL